MTITELTQMAQHAPDAFCKLDRVSCVDAVRQFVSTEHAHIRQLHAAGESGQKVLRRLSATADIVVKSISSFTLAHFSNTSNILEKISICALGGYGRMELSPCSDVDLLILCEREPDEIPEIKKFNEKFIPLLWDTGYQVSVVTTGIEAAISLAIDNPEVLTTYYQSRLIDGNSEPYTKLRLSLTELPYVLKQNAMQHIRKREQLESLPPEYQELFSTEPDIKENVGGLRDYHAAVWLLLLAQGPVSLEDLQRLGHISPDELLSLYEGIDFLWRLRNEMHFHVGRNENRLNFELQKHIVDAFGYGPISSKSLDRLMEDYYEAARQVRHFMQVAIRVCEHPLEVEVTEDPVVDRSGFRVVADKLTIGLHDPHWFAENPARLMELFWECARRNRPLSPGTLSQVKNNLHLVNEAFRSNDVVRRFFVALCNRPQRAGFVLREAASSGLLAAYIPEFAAIQGMMRYEDFHSYPVDEHTLRSIEALAEISSLGGPIGRSLQQNLEHVRDPYLLVMALLFHDLGKASGEMHVAEGQRLSEVICRRIGMSEDDTERISFLVKHHMLMTHISMYRDTDDLDTVLKFSELMRTDERLRTLYLMSYADLKGVGPAVWNDWKGALLLKLFLKAGRVLQGGTIGTTEEFWMLPKSIEVRELVPATLRRRVRPFVRGLGERYFHAFSPEAIARHLQAVETAKQDGLSVWYEPSPGAQMSQIGICTQDQHGLFAKICGCLTSHLIDVEVAEVFTTSDSYALDFFTVTDAAHRRPLTARQFEGIVHTLEEVLLLKKDVREYIAQSRKRIYALLQPRVPVRTCITFDNEASKTDTVIDVEAGDRTGLLFDMTQALSKMGVYLYSARIVTDARRVRDSFYVQKLGMKIVEENDQNIIRHGLIHAIESIAMNEPTLTGESQK